MIPFEALLPYAIMGTLLTLGGGGLAVVKAYENDYKRVRFGLDRWDRQMMERDFRLTGKVRGQVDNAIAPEFFETNHVRKLQPISKYLF
ncbi:NADH dehydrogenase [ubiquinone] 1 alpha subcomplex subunit 1 ASCRUDRAFT_78292 [Ascoidea rubescens DSM 1968]|uniref:NADH dehydrogenase [ubiquinone] 1 alpha subcomplex subunit 1 n=1 Tax=Ascoidea rubescens DSM 1968 TaxID=1344418 RepID=A0A1D2V8I4_9ASCO|nr:hypothetical protein ASCRUDRAFT_78292 [Ascoidea rubescens DSM 1968]ODV57924.1 hypothetical protein ASCRUDRAFT_78292 [Ascoidea rubescens DSM 1968]